MNVLSLFDGMSCGRIALERAGIPVTNYFASEIDKYAIQVSQKNYPDIKHIGDVKNISCINESWNDKNFVINYDINLLIGGTPCQDLRPGRDGLKGSKSKLFYEYLRILNEIKAINPNVLFFLENTSQASKEDRAIITSLLGVDYMEINSALVSAQNRKRLYWTNIPNISQPSDLGINLPEILESEVDIKYLVSEKAIERGLRKMYSMPRFDAIKSGCLNRKNNSGQMSIDSGTNFISVEKKSLTLLTTYKYNAGLDDYYIKRRKQLIKLNDGNFRRLTPIECERLQNVPDNYTNTVSDTQRYTMLGNGWNVNTITHIFKNIPTS